MILRFFDRSITMRALAKACGVGPWGTSAQQLLDAAEAAGLEAVGVRVAHTQLPDLPMPAILVWAPRHFLVLEDVTRHVVSLIDPARGRCRLRLDQCKEGFLQIALLFGPRGQDAR